MGPVSVPGVGMSLKPRVRSSVMGEHVGEISNSSSDSNMLFGGSMSHQRFFQSTISYS